MVAPYSRVPHHPGHGPVPPVISGIKLETKCTINGMHLNHLKTTPLSSVHGTVIFYKTVPDAKGLGTTVLQIKTAGMILTLPLCPEV